MLLYCTRNCQFKVAEPLIPKQLLYLFISLCLYVSLLKYTQIYTNCTLKLLFTAKFKLQLFIYVCIYFFYIVDYTQNLKFKQS